MRRWVRSSATVVLPYEHKSALDVHLSLQKISGAKMGLGLSIEGLDIAGINLQDLQEGSKVTLSAYSWDSISWPHSGRVSAVRCSTPFRSSG